MAEEQSRYFIVPSAELDLVRSTIYQSFPDALIGTKPHEEGTHVVVVTLFSQRPESVDQLLSAIGHDSLDVNAVPEARSLSDMVSEIRRLQQPNE